MIFFIFVECVQYVFCWFDKDVIGFEFKILNEMIKSQGKKDSLVYNYFINILNK